MNDSDLLMHGSFYYDCFIDELWSKISTFSIRYICANLEKEFGDIADFFTKADKSYRTPFIKFLALCNRFDLDTTQILSNIFHNIEGSGISIMNFYEFIGCDWEEIYDNSCTTTMSIKVPSTLYNHETQVQIPYYGSINSEQYLSLIYKIADICREKYLIDKQSV